MQTALEWGIQHHSCKPGKVWRESLGVQVTQAGAWVTCNRGDWLCWQFGKLPPKIQQAYKEPLKRAIEKIIVRSQMHRDKYWLRGANKAERVFLFMTTGGGAPWAMRVAREAPNKDEELRLQAEDIHKEMPEWVGES